MVENINIREYTSDDVSAMNEIWNEVVRDGVAFPQTEELSDKTGAEFFASQTYCGVAENTETKQVLGLFILHPNNIGRCGHIANASFAVSGRARGLHIGEMLVTECLNQAKLHGFKIMQFNAVVADNIHARHLYERLGFKQLGTIPAGFHLKNGEYADICPYYKTL